MLLETVSSRELRYLRHHFREAQRKNHVVCLECGAIFNSLPQHVRKHGLTIEEYKESWGYNRSNPLVAESTHRARRQVALAMNLPALSQPSSLRKALRARRGKPSPHRPETKLQQKEAGHERRKQGWRPPKLKIKDEALRLLVRQGHDAEEISLRTGLSYRQLRKRLRALKLHSALVRRFKPSKKDLKILQLRRSGLWASEISKRIGMYPRSVNKRLKRLEENGFDVPPSSTARPNAQRKVSDKRLLALIRRGFRVREIAAKVGIATKNVYWRLRRLTGSKPHPTRAVIVRKSIPRS